MRKYPPEVDIVITQGRTDRMTIELGEISVALFKITGSLHYDDPSFYVVTALPISVAGSGEINGLSSFPFRESTIDIEITGKMQENQMPARGVRITLNQFIFNTGVHTNHMGLVFSSPPLIRHVYEGGFGDVSCAAMDQEGNLLRNDTVTPTDIIVFGGFQLNHPETGYIGAVVLMK